MTQTNVENLKIRKLTREGLIYLNFSEATDVSKTDFDQIKKFRSYGSYNSILSYRKNLFILTSRLRVRLFPRILACSTRFSGGLVLDTSLANSCSIIQHLWIPIVRQTHNNIGSNDLIGFCSIVVSKYSTKVEANISSKIPVRELRMQNKHGAFIKDTILLKCW